MVIMTTKPIDLKKQKRLAKKHHILSELRRKYVGIEFANQKLLIYGIK